MPPPPNILWIVTTQWRAQACGYAGDPNAHTPYSDALAAESVNYCQAVTPHPFGPFARAALLTGVPSPENGVADYFDPLPAGNSTVADALAARGYETAFFGKWHLGKRDPVAPLVGEEHARTPVTPAERGGFKTWEGFESGFLLNDPWLQGNRLPEPVRFRGYQSDVLCGRAGAWLGETREPWFCVVSLEPPHPPYDAPAAGVPQRDPRDIQLPGNVPRGGSAEEKARRELAGYYAHIEATDRSIGRLLAQKRAEKAIVVFTSVHGDMHGAHGLFRKGWPYEESIRVPLLVRVPRTSGGRSDEAVSLLELPTWTLAWAAGDTQPRGQSRACISMPCVVRQPHQCDRPWRGIRTKSRKLVKLADGTPWLFFDLEKDPLELENLAENPARAREIADLSNL